MPGHDRHAAAEGQITHDKVRRNLMSLSRKATVGAGWMIAMRGIARLLGFANTLILARVLLPADFGLVAMAMTFEGAILVMSQFPVQDALLRRPESDTRLHDAAFTIQSGRALLTAGILAVGAPLAAAWFSEPRLTALILALAGTAVISGFINVGIIEFTRELRFDVTFKLQLVPAVLQILAVLGTAWLTHSYWALLVGIAVLRISRVGMSYVIHPYRPRLSLRGWRELVGFSFWLWLAGLASMIWGNFDTFAIGPIFGSAGIGLYTIACQVAALPTTELLIPLSDVLLASFAYGQREATRAAVNPLRVASALLLALAPVGLAISAGAAEIVSLLLGSHWSAAVPLVAIAGWSAVFQPFHSVCGAVLVARGRVRRKFLITALAAAVRVVLVTLAVFSGSLTIVVCATFGALGGGAIAYILALRSDLVGEAGHFLGGVARIAAAIAAAGLVLTQLKVGWQPLADVALDGRPQHILTLLHLGIEGTIAVGAYGLVLLALWLICGSPDGPEKAVLTLLRELVPARGLWGSATRLAGQFWR